MRKVWRQKSEAKNKTEPFSLHTSAFLLSLRPLRLSGKICALTSEENFCRAAIIVYNSYKEETVIFRRFLLILATTGTLFCTCVSEQPRLKKWVAHTYYCVSEVISGDTILVEGVGKMRYIGVCAPKLSLSGKHDEPFSQECKKENEKLLAGKWCRFELDKSQAERGTTLAYVFVRSDGEEVFVNEHLLEQGLARFSPSTINTKYNERLRKAEKTAKQNKRGMWSRISIE
jgi:endonuclease YncB( thermonuclease family)